ncbi:hypothetical protein B1F79_00885 [Coxiella-like endosymbiont of Rhipicephalus sanguineus]|nr:hypothetical protein [Coxiella-like endosymbiont of Rhipicephalus sanguineus]
MLLIVDEIQSRFSKTGKWWDYEHYDILPNVIISDKGISSSLSLSAYYTT